MYIKTFLPSLTGAIICLMPEITMLATISKYLFWQMTLSCLQHSVSKYDQDFWYQQ